MNRRLFLLEPVFCICVSVCLLAVDPALSVQLGNSVTLLVHVLSSRLYISLAA